MSWRISWVLGLVLPLVTWTTACERDGAESRDGRGSGGAGSVPKVEIGGRLLGCDEQPMALAHIHIMEADPSATPRSIEVKPSGDFAFSTENLGLIRLLCTGVDHKPLDLLLPTWRRESLHIDIRMEANSPAGGPYKPAVIGDFNRFSFSSGSVPMVLEPTGGFVARVPAMGETLRYQVIGTSADKRSINGQQADLYEYDGGGDYIACIIAGGDSVDIHYDPEELSGCETEADIAQKDPDPAAGRLMALHGEMLDRVELFDRYKNLRMRETIFTGLGRSEDLAETRRALDELSEVNLTAVLQEVRHQARKEAEPLCRELLFQHLLHLESRSGEPADKSMVAEALHGIAPQSPVWSLSPHLLQYAALVWQDDSIAAGYLKEAAGHRDEDVAQSALLTSLVTAEMEGDLQRAAGLWELSGLEQAEEDSLDQVFWRWAYGPERAIRPGNPIPDDAVPMLHDTLQVISPSDFKGRLLLIDFWATWCPYCIEELPEIGRIYERYHQDGFDVLSLCCDEDPVTARAFLERLPVPGRHAWVPGGTGGEIGRKFEILGIPKPVLVGPDGQIVATETVLRGKSLAVTVERMLRRFEKELRPPDGSVSG
ncbi:MAG: redoxin family protein [Candidatus Eisenbacteria bacterium]|nr:redoxin family protein [Candidatus Eisenbacteria bacterium]